MRFGLQGAGVPAYLALLLAWVVPRLLIQYLDPGFILKGQAPVLDDEFPFL